MIKRYTNRRILYNEPVTQLHSVHAHVPLRGCQCSLTVRLYLVGDVDGKRVHFAAVNAVKAMRRSTDSPDWYIALNDSQYDVFKQVE